MKAALAARILDGFDDPALSDATWQGTLRRGPTNTVFLTPGYQRAWWRAFGRGRLLLTVVEDQAGAGIAPLFADEGMVFFVGSGGSDVLDFVGDLHPEKLAAALGAARESTPDFVGFRFYHVPDASTTPSRLSRAADALGLRLVEEGTEVAPALDLTDRRAREEALHKKSLRRHANWFNRRGGVSIEHVTETRGILPYLTPFFEQHVRRWAQTPSPSLFLDDAQRDFYRELAFEGGGAGWVRFTVVEWEGVTLAYHFGFHYAGRWLWYKPSFAIEAARRSPGEVLLGSLIERAVEEGAEVFDFGIGDEPFKGRFATHVETVRTWGLYP